MDITRIQNGAQNGGAQESQKTGSFYNRMVELATPTNVGFAVAATAAYVAGAPISYILIGAGVVCLCKRLMAVDPFTLNLEKTKSLDAKERLAALDSLIGEFDKVSAEKQVAIIKAMTSTMEDDQMGRIRGFIQASKFDDANKSKALVDGLVDGLEKIAKDNAEQSKSDLFIDLICQLHTFLVEKKSAAVETNKQIIDRNKLHQTLDNLVSENSLIKDWIKQIKQSLPLSAKEQLDLDFKNMKARSANIRLESIGRLSAAYETADDKIEIIKAVFAMIKDNNGNTIGYQTLGILQDLIQSGKINSKLELEAVIKEFVDYINNPGARYSELLEDRCDRHREVFGRMIGQILPLFTKFCMADIKKSEVNIVQLQLALKSCFNNLPQHTCMKNIQQDINAVLKSLN